MIKDRGGQTVPRVIMRFISRTMVHIWVLLLRPLHLHQYQQDQYPLLLVLHHHPMHQARPIHTQSLPRHRHQECWLRVLRQADLCPHHHPLGPCMIMLRRMSPSPPVQIRTFESRTMGPSFLRPLQCFREWGSIKNQRASTASILSTSALYPVSMAWMLPSTPLHPVSMEAIHMSKDLSHGSMAWTR